ncbi:baseplate hub [Alteromonas phage vB_AmeM_PT11-V22]|uniref:Uncharacterized protein n=1 Tax=Alteromonas phage vB_AmeM_PT11-V22 TaxID=2704031 RepID=A0A6C0R1B1_9CAUD|nr:baseplate hub [Alteromonas phage vB_AmeM_PT11-V22]QHZ59743.1 hypothetical protein [Alteromonas phage vB_AmeM_PT11-V22]
MSYNYLRYYELIVGFPDTYRLVSPEYPSLNATDSADLTFDQKPLNFMTVQRAEGKGVSVSENQLVAKVGGTTQSKGSNARSCVITVHNLSEDTVQNLTQKNLKVILKAGYKDDYDQDNLPVVFSGQIKSSKRVLSRDVNAVELICEDGYTPSNAVKVNKTLKSTPSKTITANDVFDYLLSVWNKNGIASTKDSIRFDELPIHPSTVPFRGGWTGEGYLRDRMDEICDAFNYQWYIVNGTIYIQSAFSNKVREVIELDMSLVKGIQDGNENYKNDSNQEGKSRIKVTTFLNGAITEDKFINLTPAANGSKGRTDYTGLYKVISVSHSLDYRGNKWDTIVECESL